MALVGIFDAAIDLRKGVSIYLNFFGNRYLQFQVGHIFTVARAAARMQTRFPARVADGSSAYLNISPESLSSLSVQIGTIVEDAS